MTNAARRRRAIGDCPNASSAAPRRSRNQNAHLSQGTHSPRQLRRGRHTCTASAFRRFTRRSPAPDQPLPQRLLAHFYLVLLRRVLAGQGGPKVAILRLHQLQRLGAQAFRQAPVRPTPPPPIARLPGRLPASPAPAAFSPSDR